MGSISQLLVRTRKVSAAQSDKKKGEGPTEALKKDPSAQGELDVKWPEY